MHFTIALLSASLIILFNMKCIIGVSMCHIGYKQRSDQRQRWGQVASMCQVRHHLGSAYCMQWPQRHVHTVLHFIRLDDLALKTFFKLQQIINSVGEF